MIFWQLFIAFLEVGAFAFGGGYAALPLIEQVAVNRYHWLTLTEMTDIIALSQVTPGPIALNAATFVGTRVAGFPGAIVASLAAVLPQTLFLLFLGWFMFYGGRTTAIDRALKGLRPGITGLIAAAITECLADGAELVVTSGGMSVDPDDVTRLGIALAGAEDMVYGTPVLPGAMFLVGRIGTVPVLGLPACGMFHGITVLDLVLPRILTGETIGRAELAALGHGGLCRNCSHCQYPVCSFGKA